MLERSHLMVVREVERQGSLTAAADVLNLTQAGQYLLGLANRMLPQFELAEERMKQYAQGERGTLRIGMECHPCYQWLLKVVSPYLARWPDVDVDVKQRFQFGGIGALFGYDIDVLVTPDPLKKPGLRFQPVFDYEQVLVVPEGHALADVPYITPEQVAQEVLITYPVETDRLDIYTRFLTPANAVPRRHKVIETTDIMLQMVASGRGVAALPRWLAEEYAGWMPLTPLRLGKKGIAKQIFLGTRESDDAVDYLTAFVKMAHEADWAEARFRA